MNNPTSVSDSYRARLQHLVPMARSLEAYLCDLVRSYPRIDRVAVRAKEEASFLRKATKTIDGIPKYADPLSEIQDQIGARIVTFYSSDVQHVSRVVEDYFGPIESRRVAPESHREFGYEGMHYVLFIPSELYPAGTNRNELPEFFELQIKTLFQHAWGQADHDLAYKTTKELTHDQVRKVAFTAAQAWGADQIFDQLAAELLN